MKDIAEGLEYPFTIPVVIQTVGGTTRLIANPKTGQIEWYTPRKSIEAHGCLYTPGEVLELILRFVHQEKKRGDEDQAGGGPPPAEGAAGEGRPAQDDQGGPGL